MRIAILGAGGFIGSHMVEHLLAAGQHQIIGIDRRVEKLDEVVSDLTPAARARWRFLETDIRHDPELVEEVVRRSDIVVDLIAHANPSLYVSSPLEVFELNFTQNLAVAKICADAGKWLIQYSSAEVYGKSTEGPYTEDGSDAVFGPVHKQRWIYACSKHLLERVLYAHGAADQLRYTIIRPFNFLGSRIDYLVAAGETGGPRVFPHFMSALLTGGPIRLVDGGYAHRAFLHIDDGTRAFQTLLDHPEAARNQSFNVGNPANNVTIRQFAALMIETYEELTGERSRSDIECISGEEFYGEGYEDSDRQPPDISKLGALGWKPRHDLRTAVRDAMTYYLAEQMPVQRLATA